MYLVQPSFSQKCVASVFLKMENVCSGKMQREVVCLTYVTPFPNHEWVSSCATTSTKALSPARSAV